MASLNQCNFIGNLGKDPEIRAMQDGKKVASFSIACSESWKDKGTGERKERTEWISCSVWGALAGVVESYVRKGSKVFVSGKFTTRSWDDPSGQKKYKTEIVVSDLVMLDGKREGGNEQAGYAAGQQSAQAGQAEYPEGTAEQDDLPF